MAYENLCTQTISKHSLSSRGPPHWNVFTAALPENSLWLRAQTLRPNAEIPIPRSFSCIRKLCILPSPFFLPQSFYVVVEDQIKL